MGTEHLDARLCSPLRLLDSPVPEVRDQCDRLRLRGIRIVQIVLFGGAYWFLESGQNPEWTEEWNDFKRDVEREMEREQRRR